MKFGKSEDEKLKRKYEKFKISEQRKLKQTKMEIARIYRKSRNERRMVSEINDKFNLNQTRMGN